MSKTLYLHIGMPKTGSTSIQDTLYANREKLRANDIYYPDIFPQNHSWSFGPIVLGHNDFNEYLIVNGIKKEKQKKLYARTLKKQWYSEIKKCKNQVFIVSFEGMFLDPSTGAGKDTRAYRTLKFFSRYFDQIKIVIYVRQPLDYFSSFVQQCLKNQYSSLDEIKKHIPEFDLYSKQLNKIITHYGRENIIVRPFVPQRFHQGSLVADFLYTINPSRDFSFINEIRSNESLSDYNCKFLSEFIKVYPRGKIPSVREMETGHPIMNNILEHVNIEGDQKFAIDLKIDEALAERINHEIDYINAFFHDGFRFKYVETKSDSSQTNITDLPAEYFSELIAQYHKKHEKLKSAVISAYKADTLDEIIDQTLEGDGARQSEKMTLRDYIELINRYNAKIAKLWFLLKNKKTQ